MKTLIFTDLDGTFLNHDDYSFEPGREALLKIKEKNIPLIFTTSKTKSEVIKLQNKVGIKEPFIIENGAALFIPKNYQNLNLDHLDDFEDYKILVFGKKYDQILSFYNKYKDDFGLKGFSDLSLDEVCNLTGLEEEQALLSLKRDFTEPFLIEDDSKLENLKNLALTYNIKITQGGRFFHLIGEKQDKGIAVKRTLELFRELYNESNIKSIALGDGPNDIVMFENVDIPIIIQNHKGEYVNCDIENIQRSSKKGSFGFNEMVVKNV
jgi:mannosyl-3-phosphoglycerate phosphatase